MDAHLVLIHGFWSTASTWDALIRALANDHELRGLRIHTFEYESPKLRLPFSRTRIPDYDDIGRSLPAFITAKAPGDAPVVFVTHSQGGLILQRFLAWAIHEGRGRELDRVRAAIMLACPNEGSEYVRSIRAITGFGRHPQASQLKVLAREVGEARRVVLRNIVNATSPDDRNCPIPIYCYAGRSDNIVSLQSSQSVFPLAESLPGDHFSILDPRAPGNITAPTIAHRLKSLVAAPLGTGTPNSTGPGPSDALQERVAYLYGLPADLPDFTGRRDHIETVTRLLNPEPREVCPVVALSGKPGVGKSALAIRVAHVSKGTYFDGQLYVNLRGQSGEAMEPLEVLTGFLLALGVKREELFTGELLVAQFRSLTHDRRLLFVFDNARDERQVRPLLPASTTCGVIVTSRSVMASLETSDEVNLEAVDPIEALALLAAVSRRDLENELEAALAIVRHCGGLPLALRIAGALLRKHQHWSVSRLADELTSESTRIDRLQVGDLQVADSFSLSLRDVDRETVALFCTLALLPYSTFTAHTVADLLDLDENSVRRSLDVLANSQLLEGRAPDRFGFHDLIRVYATQLTSEHEKPSLTKVRLNVRLAEQFEELYIWRLRETLSRTIVPDSESLKVFSLDATYVEQRLAPVVPNASDKGLASAMSWAEAMKLSSHLVILGEPGSGKTALAQHICTVLATPGIATESGHPLPILVPLRGWQSGDLAAFITTHLRSQFQVELTPEVLDLLLHSGRALIILDGLDEVLDVQRRAELVGEIRALVASYPEASVVVLSRPADYGSTALDAFTVVKLLPWGLDQVDEFVKSWFATAEATPELAQRLADSFLSESPGRGDVRFSPLILIQLASMYRSHGYLARNRAELFERVVLSSWDRWDLQRGIRSAPRQDGRWVDRLLERLALQLMDRPDGGLALSAQEVYEVARTTLGEEWDASESAAYSEQLVDGFRSRATVFMPAGVTPDGTETFGFAFSGIAEYLAARALTRSLDAESRSRELLRLLDRRRSSEILEFALALADRYYERGASDLVATLLQQSATLEWHDELLDRIRRCAADLRLSPEVRRELGDVG